MFYRDMKAIVGVIMTIVVAHNENDAFDYEEEPTSA